MKGLQVLKMGRLALAAVVWVLSPVLVSAHGGDRIIHIPQLATADTARIDLRDGSVAEWEDLVGPPSLTASDFMPRERSPSGIDFRIWLAWLEDPVRLFVALEVADDIYAPDVWGDADSWPGDGRFDILIDGDHSGQPHDGNEYHDGRFGQMYSVRTVAAKSRGDRRLLPFAESGRESDSWYASLPLADVGASVFGESPTILQSEFFVTPFDLLLLDSAAASDKSSWSVGDIVGLHLVYFDRDEGSRLTVFQLGSTGSGLYDAVLAARRTAADAGLAADTVPWARIKARSLSE